MANTRQNKKQSSMISLVYQFIFERDANIWTNVYQFEDDLADFFKANGLEAAIVDTVDGSMGGRMFFIKKIASETPTLDNLKGVDVRPRLGPPSSSIVKGLTGQLNKSYTKKQVKRGNK